MFGSRQPLYVPFLIGGLLISQIVPTFGAYLGLPGNWLPFFCSLAVVGSGVGLYLLKGGLSDRAVQLTFFLYWVVAVGHTVALMLVYSELATLAEYADIIRWLSVPVFLVGGFIYGRETEGPLRGLFRVVVLLVLFTGVLFIDFLAGPWSGLQRLYVQGQIGLGRFPGNWNYPYDLSVALFFYITAVSIGVVRARKQRWVVPGIVVICVCVLLIVIGQSRGSLLALGVACGLAAAHSAVRMGLRGRMTMSPKPAIALGVIAGGVLLSYSLIDVPLYELSRRYASRLVALTGGGVVEAIRSPERMEELERMVGYFSESPLNLLWGFGPFRKGEFWIQNILLLVFRYGVLGFTMYILVVPAMTIRRGLGRDVRWWTRTATIGYLYWLIFIFANSISHDIFTHYRFMPLFYFVTGVLLALPGREAALALEGPRRLAGRQGYSMAAGE